LLPSEEVLVLRSLLLLLLLEFRLLRQDYVPELSLS
jgi:hypothetical protein